MDAQAEVEAVERDQRQRHARSPRRGRSAGCPGTTRSRRTAARRRPPSRARRSAARWRRRRPSRGSTTRHSVGAVRSTSSPSSAWPCPPRSTSTASATAQTRSRTATAIGKACGPTRSESVVGASIRRASTRTTTPTTPSRRATPSSERPASRRRAVARGRCSCQTQLAQGVADALVLLTEEGAELVAGQEGVGPAVGDQGVLPLLASRASS